MIFNNPYWSTRTKLDLLARWLIVHSIIYYEIGTSIISDKSFDDNSRQYVWLRKEERYNGEDSRWNYVMHDFDGTTGFQLFSRLNEADKKRLMHEATNLVRKYRNF